MISLSSVLLSVPLALAEAIPAHPKEAEAVAGYAWVLPLLPLIGFILLIFLGGRLRRDRRQACVGMAGERIGDCVFGLALGILLQLLSIRRGGVTRTRHRLTGAVRMSSVLFRSACPIRS